MSQETQGSRLKILRENMLKISQERVARKIGVTRRMIILWENCPDERYNISEDNLIKLAQLFGVTIDFIALGSPYKWRHDKKTNTMLPPKSAMRKDCYRGYD